MASLLHSKLEQFELRDATGEPAAGYYLHFFTTGTTTYKNTYPTEADAIAGTNANSNPIQLDSQGRCPVDVWIAGRYKRVFTSESTVPISSGITTDPIEDFVTGSDAQDSTPTFGGNNSGTADALALTFSPALTAYTNGQVLRGRITADNTSAVTVNCNGLGVKSLVKQDGTALQAGDLQGPGIIEFAYDSTTDVFRLMSPDGHLFRNGRNEPGRVDIADGATLDLSPATVNSRYVRAITSTTAVTAITLPDGNVCKVLFNTARTLTHGASLVLPGGVNITTVAGDIAEFVGESGGVVRCTQYLRASGSSDGLLSTTTASAAASADITLPSGYRYYEVIFDASVGTDAAELVLRIGTGAPPTYQSGATDYEHAQSTVFCDATVANTGSQGDTGINLAVNIGNAATESVAGDVRIYNPASATLNKLITYNAANWDNAATPLLKRTTGSGSYNAATTAITGLQFLASTGTITGTFKLYGYA